MASVDPAENEDQPETEPEPAVLDPNAPNRRRDPKFRVELIGRLPKMTYSSWSAKENFKLDEEWGGVIALQSDAILGPLEPIATGRSSQGTRP